MKEWEIGKSSNCKLQTRVILHLFANCIICRSFFCAWWKMHYWWIWQFFCDCKRNRIHLFILQNSDFEYFKWESKKTCMSGEMVVSYEALLYNQKFWTLIDEEKRWFLICLVKYIVHICSLQVVNLFILVGIKGKQYIYFFY